MNGSWKPHRVVLTITACSVFFFYILACSCPFVHCEERLIDDFSGAFPGEWVEKIFQGKTAYGVVNEKGRFAVKAVSRAAASALYRKIDWDIKSYPYLAWSWKIKQVLENGDARRKETDDYAGRIYVVFPSWFFWKTRSLTYIWANKLPAGSAVKSPYTTQAVMIAVESGNAKAGEWIHEKCNVLEDYRRFFGEDPPGAGAIAIMTDTDNTGESTTAWYGAIRISTSP